MCFGPAGHHQVSKNGRFNWMCCDFCSACAVPVVLHTQLDLHYVSKMRRFLTFRDLMSTIVDVPHRQPPKFHFIYLFNKYRYRIF